MQLNLTEILSKITFDSFFFSIFFYVNINIYMLSVIRFINTIVQKFWIYLLATNWIEKNL